MNSYKSLIVGMGKTGHSFAEYLLANDMSFDFADTRTQPAAINEFERAYAEKGAKFYLGDLDHVLLDEYQQLLVSPGVDTRHDFIQAAKNKDIPIKGDIDLFVSSIDARVIGITGSNGKTTLTALFGYALQGLSYSSAVGGNIGTAALTLLAEKEKDIYVLELSSFQLDISNNVALDVAVVLNVTEDHLDRYDSFNDYISSKASIYNNAKVKVINLDDAICKGMYGVGSKDAITFSLHDATANVYYSLQDAAFYIDGEIVAKAEQFQLRGMHNYQNILAALSIAKAIDLDCRAFIDVISHFSGLPHRCELVSEIDGVAWINDSKATNVGAASAAMHSIQKPLHIIMGGQAKGVDFTQFANDIPAYVKNIILLGEDADFIRSFVESKVNVVTVNNMAEAVNVAKSLCAKGDTVLLSPACASLDMYSSYEQRGDDFKRLVTGVAV